LLDQLDPVQLAAVGHFLEVMVDPDIDDEPETEPDSVPSLLPKSG
jgi:hypothetical protein